AGSRAARPVGGARRQVADRARPLASRIGAMARWGTTTVLDHPPEAVWRFLTDDANDANWRAPWVEAGRQLTDGPLRVGTRYETLYRFFGRSERVIVEITELDGPRRMAWRQVDSVTIEENTG